MCVEQVVFVVIWQIKLNWNVILMFSLMFSWEPVLVQLCRQTWVLSEITSQCWINCFSWATVWAAVMAHAVISVIQSQFCHFRHLVSLKNPNRPGDAFVPLVHVESRFLCVAFLSESGTQMMSCNSEICDCDCEHQCSMFRLSKLVSDKELLLKLICH